MRIDPKIITGSWDKGFALDKHYASKEYTGKDNNGRDLYKTTKTELGRLVKEMRETGSLNASREIAALIRDFLNTQKLISDFQFIIPVPSKRGSVNLLAEQTAKYLECCAVKNVITADGNGNLSKGRIAKRKVDILLLDDVYTNGDIPDQCVRLLRQDSNICKIYFLAVTYAE